MLTSPNFRRTRWCAALTTLVVLVAWAAPGSAEGDFELGSADARANVFRIGPTAGGLEAVLTFGQSIAKYTAQVGQGQSRTIDTAVIGLVLAAEGCDGSDPTWPEEDQPPTVRVDSRDEGSAQGTTVHYVPYGEGNESYALGNQFAQATDQPYGHAVTELLPVSIPGLLEVKAGTATATSQVIDGAVREAHSVSEVGQVSLLDGQVVINGLRWEAIQRTDAPETEIVPEHADTSGVFAADSITVAGQTIPLDALPADEVGAALESLNPLVESTGLVIDWPQVESIQGVSRVTPLRVAIDQSSLGQQVVGPVLEAIQPGRDVVTDQVLFQISCKTQAYVLVGDVVIGVPAGSGALLLEFGGVSAFTEGTAFENPFGDGLFKVPLPQLPAAPPQVLDTGTLAPAPVAPPAPPPPAASAATPVAQPPAAPLDLISEEVRDRTVRALVTLGALLTLAVAGADALKVRRSRRMLGAA